ncbi:hypothetical protein [uncultured Tateyamaria sp.]|uniref:hypothetical protein n=1 Tax=uncultured Tateyamaria sp. TaxID=455651 RepID=UPI00261B4A5C|nr:hypothetical protein [uncultured Tateyamaria sp.]
MLDPSEPWLTPEFLDIPALNCLALSLEIGMKGLLVAKGEAPETLKNKYGHKLRCLWEDNNMVDVRSKAEKESIFWNYPEHWRVTDSKYQLFETHLYWLNDVFSGMGAHKDTLILRYPVGDRTEYFPPEFMVDASGVILGIIHDKIQNEAVHTCEQRAVNS